MSALAPRSLLQRRELACPSAPKKIVELEPCGEVTLCATCPSESTKTHHDLSYQQDAV